MAEQVAEALERLEEQRRQDAGRSRRPAAGVGALGRARVDAGDARHGAQPRAQRRVGQGPGRADRATSASPGTPTGASCRCSATSRAGSPASASRTRSRRPRTSAGVTRRHRARRRRAARADRHASRASTARRPARTSPRTRSEQLRLAIRAVFDSWVGERAVAYRRLNRIPDDWGTAVNVQQMVFGNKGDTSGSGVAFSRDEVTGAPEPSGDFLPNAQGEDVVSGVRTPRDIAEMKEWMPEVHEQLMEILRTLEAHYEDMQDTEFTVEEGQLYMLQTRNAKRPAQAAVRFAVDAVAEGLLTRERALLTIDPGIAGRAAAPHLRPQGDVRGAGLRRQRVAGRGQGRDRVHRRRRRRRRRGGPRRDPRAPVHRRRGRGRLPRRQGDPHLRGRQGLARRAGGARDGPPGRGRRPGAGDRPRGQDASASTARKLHEGDAIAIDGTKGQRDHRRRAAGRGAGRRELPAGAAVGRRGPPHGRAHQRRHPRGRPARPRARRAGHRAVPHRAHVHGRGPPAQDAGDDHGRRPRRAARRPSPSCCRSSRRTSRGSSRRWPGCRSPSACSTRRCTSSCPTCRGSRRRRSSGPGSRSQTTCAASGAAAGARAGDLRGEPDARHPRLSGWGSSTPRSTRCRSTRSCAPPRPPTSRPTPRS